MIMRLWSSAVTLVTTSALRVPSALLLYLATASILKGHFTLWKKPLYRRLIVFTTTF